MPGSRCRVETFSLQRLKWVPLLCSRLPHDVKRITNSGRAEGFLCLRMLVPVQEPSAQLCPKVDTGFELRRKVYNLDADDLGRAST